VERRHMTICYTSEVDYRLIRQELYAINAKYRISQKGGKAHELSLQVRKRWENLRKKYVEMSRQRYLLTVSPRDRKKNTQLVNKAHSQTRLDN